jgi:3-oxoadipate enol-lactonase
VTPFASAECGSPGAPWVVLHSSLACTHRMWDPQADALHAAGLNVLRYDYRGHGRSAAVPGPYTLADLGGDTLALLAQHGIKRAVHVGLSLGGMVAMWLAQHAPEAVSGLVLCATSAALGPSEVWHERGQAALRTGMRPVADMFLPRWFTAEFADAYPEVVAAVEQQILATTPAGFAGGCDAIATMDLLGDLPSIIVPTAVLVGRDDPGTPPEHARRIAVGIPSATLTELDPGAHLLNLQRPEPVTAAIRDIADGVRL